MATEKKKKKFKSAVIRREMAIKALQLKMAGYTYDAISEQLQYTDETGTWKAYHNAGAACKAVNQLLKQYETEVTADFKRIHLQRLEEIIASNWTTAIMGSNGYEAAKEKFQATKLVLEAMRDMARITGIEDQDDRDKGRFTLTWDLPKRLPEDQILEMNKLHQEHLKQLTPPSSSPSSEDNGKQ